MHEKLSQTNVGHKGNISLSEKFYSPDELETQVFKLLIPVLSGTFLQSIRFGPLLVHYRQVSLYK